MTEQNIDHDFTMEIKSESWQINFKAAVLMVLELYSVIRPRHRDYIYIYFWQNSCSKCILPSSR